MLVTEGAMGDTLRMRMRVLIFSLAVVATLVPSARQATAATAVCNGHPATIVGTPRDDIINGTSGRDVIAAGTGHDIIRGFGGNDLICAGAGNDIVLAGSGNDVVFGQGGDDLVRGTTGVDKLRGGKGSDTLYGGNDADDLIGGSGPDTMWGGAGVDAADGEGGTDWCRQVETRDSCFTLVPTNPTALKPLSIRTDATFEHIGLVWNVTDDVDLDSRLVLEYRKEGASGWQPAAPAMRAYPGIYVQDGPLGLDSWGASAMFLEEATSYQIRATLLDPDGGGTSRTVTAMTRRMPQSSEAGTDRYVVAGAGGGAGTPGNPYRGLQTAADNATPGDHFHVAAGSYEPFQLLTSGNSSNPIVFSGPATGTARIDGGGTDRGVITLGEYDRTLGHVIVEGLTVEDGRWGIDAQHTHDIVIRDSTIRDVDYGIVNRRGDGAEHNQTVCDNTIVGRTPWPGSGIPSERGIDLRGTGNVVCHNQVQYFGDCVSVQPFTGASFGNDVHGNDASYCVDDGIEVDYNQANVRVWRNRVMNARMGVSVQPIRGGPAYIFRNEFFNLESKPIKMHNYTTGFFVVHNTGAKHGDGHTDGAMWRNAMFRNNLFLGTRYAFEFTTVADEGFRDLDWNGWGTTRAIGSPSDPYFKWDNVRYDRIGDLPAGVEDHGRAVDFSDLKKANLPADWDVAVPPGTRNLLLATGSAGINGGTAIPNLNDPFDPVGFADLGAFERGSPRPHYGPR